MCNSKFKKFIKKALTQSLARPGLEASLKQAASLFTDYFPESKIWFARRLGRRVSYVAGSGKENYGEAQEIETGLNFLIYVQNCSLDKKEKEALISFTQLMIFVKGDKDESQ